MRCEATSSRTGERCKNQAIEGGNVCRSHGGAAPQVKQAAERRVNERLSEMLPDGLDEVERILDDPDASDSDKLRAVQDIMDRIGPIKKHRQEQTGAGGGPIQHDVTHEFDWSRLSDDELATVERLLGKARVN